MPPKSKTRSAGRPHGSLTAQLRVQDQDQVHVQEELVPPQDIVNREDETDISFEEQEQGHATMADRKALPDGQPIHSASSEPSTSRDAMQSKEHKYHEEIDEDAPSSKDEETASIEDRFQICCSGLGITGSTPQ